MKRLECICHKIFYLAAVSLMAQACSLKEPLIDSSLRAADNQENSGNLVTAEQSLLKIIESNDTDQSFCFFKLIAQTRLANCYVKDHKYIDAVQASCEALNLCKKIYGVEDPLNTSILFTLATAQTGLKQYDEAASTYKTIITLSKQPPNNYPARCVVPFIKLGDLALQQNKANLAVSYYESARSIQLPSPVDDALISRLALSYIFIGNDLKAESYFKKISLEPSPMNGSFPLAIHNYVQFLKIKGRNNEALAIEKITNNWSNKNKIFHDWLCTRKLSPNSRFRLIGKYIDYDYATLNHYIQDKRYLFPVKE